MSTTSKASPNEVSWESLDKKRFFVNGVGIFSGVMIALYPLTVIKTRLMVLPDRHQGMSGALQMAREVLAESGPRGLYRGFGMVLLSAIPGRVMYLGILEQTKAATNKSTEHLELSPATQGWVDNFVGGAAASLAGQTIVVPVDVISQRLMVQDGSKKLSNSALSMAQSILQKEGVRGLYRGFAASLVTVTPSSAIWWGSYGFYTKMMWEMFSTDRDFEGPVDTSKVAGLQVVSGLCAGLTSGLLTNPLDVIKTRLQVSQTGTDGKRPTLKGTVQELVSNHGIMGFTRGLVPRMANTALWGTCMVCAYEFLKRLSVRQ